MQLDDFLELERAPWSSIVILCHSSYGVGQAPLGGYRFRELCDFIVEKNKTTLLKDLKFCLLGLGDSKYTTFFQNPEKTNQALELAGATRIGDVGKADAANGKQSEAIDKWIGGLWKPLEEALKNKELASQERLDEMQRDTIAICTEINPDFVPEPSSTTATSPMLLYVVAVLLALIAIAVGYTMM